MSLSARKLEAIAARCANLRAVAELGAVLPMDVQRVLGNYEALLARIDELATERNQLAAEVWALRSALENAYAEALHALGGRA